MTVYLLYIHDRISKYVHGIFSTHEKAAQVAKVYGEYGFEIAEYVVDYEIVGDNLKGLPPKR